MTAAKSKLDTGLVRELAAILRDADLGELEVEHEGLRIRVSKPTLPPAPAAVAAFPAAPAPVAPTFADMSTETPPPETPASSAQNAVSSPMVGTVYLSPEPGAAKFVSVGDKVKAGETLLLVEAMKTFNAVESPRAGVVKSVLVEDGQPVEFGEPLIVVE